MGNKDDKKKVRVNLKPVPTEDQEQEALVRWLDLKGIKFTHIPNSTFTRSWKQKAKNKRMGVRKGFPDLVVMAPRKLLFIELKRTKGGVTSSHQKEWIDGLNEYSVSAKVCKGCEEAIEFIKKYI